MRRFLLLFLVIILSGFGLMAGYVMWDYDPDDVSPMADGPSYRFIFDETVRRRMGKVYDQLDPASQGRALADIIGSADVAPAREVALFKARELADKNAAFTILTKHLDALNDEQYEVAINSIKALGRPGDLAFLDSLYKKLDADPAAHTPLGDYRPSSLLFSRADPDMNMKFQEHSRVGADYAMESAREISFFFPTGPEYILSVPNSDDVLSSYHESRFGRKLENTPIPGDAWTLPMMRTLASLRKRLDETMGMLAPYFSPERLFRDQLIIGKYGDEYLIASFKDKNVTVAEALMNVFSGLGGNFGITRWEVEGNTIASVRNLKSGRTLNYAVVGDYFIAATDTALITRAVRTYAADRASAIAIDPMFNKSFSALDQSGEKDVLFAWFDPTDYFAITGSSNPAGRRLAVVTRALGRTDSFDDSHSTASSATGHFPHTIASTVMTGDDPMMFWRYIVDVRSLGHNPLDSLARLAKVDIGRQIIPHLMRSMALGYGGVEHLRQNYGYSNTGFDLLMAMPLRSAPDTFDSTLKTFFSGITSLVYSSETLGRTRLWIARDTITNDSLLRERKLQPSFAVIDGYMLLVASTPALLRASVPGLADMGRPAGLRISDKYLSGMVKVDSLAVNAQRYLRSYLLRGDRYTPKEIDDRIGPLRDALELYDNFQWTFDVEDGLRHGKGQLVAKK